MDGFIALEQTFKGAKQCFVALRVVHTARRKDQGAAALRVGFDLLDELLDRWGIPKSSNDIRTGANRCRHQLHAMAVVLQPGCCIWLGEGTAAGEEVIGNLRLGSLFDGEQAGCGPGKVLRIAGNVEADGIAAEEAFDDLFPPGQDAEDITAGEGRVVKEADLDVGSKGSNEPGR